MKMKAKMKSKMDEKWMKKANCERPYYINDNRRQRTTGAEQRAGPRYYFFYI